MTSILKLMNPELPQTTVVDRSEKKSGGMFDLKKIILIAGGLLLILILALAAYMMTRPKLQEAVVTPPLPPSGAMFILSADQAEATLGAQIKVSVLVKSDADSANLFVAKLKFPNNLLEAKSIDLRSESSSSGFIKNWFISNWVENTIDNETGSVSLVGGVPNPGFQTQSESSGSAMADIIFALKAPGDANITFDDTSTIYRNSDNANILVSKTGVTVKILGENPVTSSVPASITPTPTSSGSLEGDVNQDGKVDLQDLSVLLSVWGNSQGQYPKADINQDGVINSFDYSKLNTILKDAGLVQ